MCSSSLWIYETKQSFSLKLLVDSDKNETFIPELIIMFY